MAEILETKILDLIPKYVIIDYLTQKHTNTQSPNDRQTQQSTLAQHLQFYNSMLANFQDKYIEEFPIFSKYCGD